jgi:AraC-like DNA-binding protein
VGTTFDFLSIFLIVILFQGAFILSVLAIKYTFKASQHVFLFLMILSLVWFQAEFLSVRMPYDVRLGLFYGTRYGAWLLLGPLYYFYVRSIVGAKFRRRDLFHFAPFFLFWLILPLFAAGMIGNQQVHYGMLSTFYPFIRNMLFLQYVYAALFVVQFIHMFVYLLISYRETQQYERSLKALYSKVDTSIILWLKTLNIFLITVVVFVSVFLAIYFIYHTYTRELDYIYVIPTAILTYIISYKLAGVQWTASTSPGEKKKYERTVLKPEASIRIRKQLEDLMKNSKPYLNNELRLQDLSDQLNVPAYQLSQVINDQLDLTFFDYINKHRVNETKRLIEDEPELTLLEIAFKAGFNNKTSFNSSFKKFTTQTAVDFKKKLKKGQSS